MIYDIIFHIFVFVWSSSSGDSLRSFLFSAKKLFQIGKNPICDKLLEVVIQD